MHTSKVLIAEELSAQHIGRRVSFATHQSEGLQVVVTGLLVGFVASAANVVVELGPAERGDTYVYELPGGARVALTTEVRDANVD